jgi:hypothetical protein
VGYPNGFFGQPNNFSDPIYTGKIESSPDDFRHQQAIGRLFVRRGPISVKPANNLFGLPPSRYAGSEDSTKRHNRLVTAAPGFGPPVATAATFSHHAPFSLSAA